MKSITDRKIWRYSHDPIEDLISTLRAKSQIIVMTCGTFSLIHVGHVLMFEHAKQMGDILVVAMNSDSSLSSLKGKSRVFMLEDHRAKILSSFEAVDYVVIYDGITADAVVEKVKPNIFVKGGDYNPNEVNEATTVRLNGGEMCVTHQFFGFSSTQLIKDIVELNMESKCRNCFHKNRSLIPGRGWHSPVPRADLMEIPIPPRKEDE